ncbi:MAG: hypothetical protein ACO3EZ_13925, partial [Prochlorotrichaceae cyanobacterium]
MEEAALDPSGLIPRFKGLGFQVCTLEADLAYHDAHGTFDPVPDLRHGHSCCFPQLLLSRQILMRTP